MSDGGNRWLRNHFHEFVFPAFMASEKLTSQIGQPFDVKISPKAPEELPTELKKLWTLCMETNTPWDFDVREINHYGGQSKYREQARIHHRLFVDTLKSATAAIRAEGCSRLFFGGRDVWSLAVLSARHRIPYLFVPELSRNVSTRPEVKPFLESLGFDGTELFLDTGFAGSIPRNMQKYWPERPFKFRLMSQNDVLVDKSHFEDCDPLKDGKFRKEIVRYKRRPNQLFPNRAKAREEALSTEYLAKYWRAGTCGFDTTIHTGQVFDVFNTWPSRKNVRKFQKPGRAPYYVCIWDDELVIEVFIQEALQVPGLMEWIAMLPEEAPKERVVQYFSDKRTIQRAGLLTSMLWRGIPYWKSAMAKEQPQKTYSGGTFINNGIQAFSTAGVSFNQTTFTNTINMTAANAVNWTIGPGTFGTNAITTASTYLDPQKMQVMQAMAKAHTAMQGVGTKAPLPPSTALPALPPAPPESKPVEVTIEQIDNGW